MRGVAAHILDAVLPFQRCFSPVSIQVRPLVVLLQVILRARAHTHTIAHELLHNVLHKEQDSQHKEQDSQHKQQYQGEIAMKDSHQHL